MSGARILELLETVPLQPTDHDFSAPLAGGSSLTDLVANTVLQVFFGSFGMAAADFMWFARVLPGNARVWLYPDSPGNACVRRMYTAC